MGENHLRNIPVFHFEVNLNKALKKAIYKPVDIKQIISIIKHLNQEQKVSLLKVLKRHKGLFQGRHGQWTGDNVLIKLKQNASPFYGKAYPILLKQLEVIKNEVYWQCKIGALRELKEKDVENCPWAFLAFRVPKKDGTIQLVTGFRKLNTMLVWLEYPLPTIDGLIQSIVVFNFMTGLDLNMGLLSMTLDEWSKMILTITIPFGLFECQVLPQGVKQATDIF